MSDNMSPKHIQFPNQWGIQTVDDLKTDLEPSCNIPCSTGRNCTRDDTVKKTVEPEKSPEEETDKNESIKSVKVSENAKTEEPEKSPKDETDENQSSKSVKVSETVEPENSPDPEENKSTQVKKKDEKLWKKVGNDTVKKTVEPEKPPEEETDENQSSKSVKVSENAKTEEPEKYPEDETDEDEVSETVEPENSTEKNRRSRSTQVKKKDEKLWKKVGKLALWTAAGTVVISGVVLGSTAFIVKGIGFGALGPIARSFAASYQSTQGGKIAAGSVFATLQRVGMVGLSTSAKTRVVVGSAAASATVVTKLNQKKKKKE